MPPVHGPRCSAPGHEGRDAEAGYTLAMFIMIIAVMSIMMGVAVQTVSFAMQREREAELIFRGEQYVEAIRLFRAKYGRYPMRLKELWEAKPRVIRKKWKDPMTDTVKWKLVFLGQEGGPLRGRGGLQGTPGPSGTPVPEFGGQVGEDPNQPGGRTQKGPDGEMIGPIVGVHSPSCEESIKIYEGHNRYCDWRFIFREEQQGRRGRGRNPRGGNVDPRRDWLRDRGDDRSDDSGGSGGPRPTPNG